MKILGEDSPVIDFTKLNGNTLSSNVLLAIKKSGKAVEIIISASNSDSMILNTISLIGNILITIDPNSISNDVEDFNFSVAFGITTKDIFINDVKVPVNSLIIAPAAKGSFGFDMTLMFKEEQLQAAGIKGDNIKLFYVDDNGAIINMGMVKYNTDGSISITINHSSYYYISGMPIETEAESNPKTSVSFSITTAL